MGMPKKGEKHKLCSSGSRPEGLNKPEKRWAVNLGGITVFSPQCHAEIAASIIVVFVVMVTLVANRQVTLEKAD